LAAIVSFLRRPGQAGWALAVIPCYLAGIYTAEALVVPMLVDAGWSLQHVGLARAGLAEPLAVVAALGAGVAVGRLGRRRAATVFGVAQVAAIAAMPLAVAAGATVSAGVVTTVFTIAMDISRRTAGATDYSLQFSIVGVCRIVANTAGLALAGGVGYGPALLAAALFAAAGTLLVHRRLPALPVPSAGSSLSALGSGDRS
jgi:hypothetical protein